ncbi:MAG: hypothetical protein P4L84_25860 [Isosphaeraceae bacterium]|nr:hypothetical protein [Isosphaeraceae bacterium]
MPRFARPCLVTALVALHATVMLCGACLHGLPGWGHRAALSRAADGDHSRDAGKPNDLRPDDCPVCHFVAQAQLATELACAPAVEQGRECKLETRSDAVTPALLYLQFPRGPPALWTSPGWSASRRSARVTRRCVHDDRGGRVRRPRNILPEADLGVFVRHHC